MTIGHVCVRGAGIVVHAWASREGLAAVHLGPVPPEATERGERPVAGIEIGEVGKELSGLEAALREYLKGLPLAWEGGLDARGLTGFQREVLEAVRRIPFGEVRTYRQVARKIGRPAAVRAVGNALHRNPFPLVVPCHRVLREGGSLGGFAGGVEMKRHLLALEAGQIELPWGREES